MIGNRFKQLPENPALSIFFTAGYPRLNDTMPIITALQASGVDMVEVGFPFSDPVADGPTIQESNLVALANGMTIKLLFEQLSKLRSGSITMPVLLMGYLNPVERYGCERFFEEAARCGIDALILPDMPFDEYLARYRPLFKRNSIQPVFLITTRTEDERIRELDAEDPAFLYVVSSDAITGGRAEVSQERERFFKHLMEMGLKSRLIVGFGVSDRESFNLVTKHTDGAIIGSAFLRKIAKIDLETTGSTSPKQEISSYVADFIKQIRHG